MYNGARLIPAPFVSVNKDYQSTADGTKIGTSWTLTITGTIVAFKGSPNSQGVLWTSSGFPPDEFIDENSRLGSMIRKQEAIRELFSEDGYQLEFQSEDGTQPMKCNPRIQSITFAEGIWFDRLEYTIVCQADVLYVNGLPYGEDDFTAYIESATENWEIETQEEPEDETLPRTYRLTHTLSAKGKRFFDDTGALVKPAWQQAKDWVTPRLGLDSYFISNSNVKDLTSSYTGYNHVRSENIGELDGEYSVTESWFLAISGATETFEISTTSSVQDGLTKVSIDGTVTGLETRNANMGLIKSKYDNATDKFNSVFSQAFSRAQLYSGITLNTVALSTTVGRNPAVGTYRYTIEYDDRPSNIIPNSRSEVISIQDSLPTDYPVPIFVLGRTRGPVIQNMGTSRERTRALNIELVMPIPTGTLESRLAAYPDVSAIVAAAKPTGNIVLIQENSRGWDISNGRFTYNVTWIWE